MWDSEARFKVGSAARRGGKTELAKRKLVRRALAECEVLGARFIFAAPTFAQAKDIFWQDAQDLVPEPFIVGVNKTELRIDLVNGAQILVRGLDKPERIEGTKVRHIVIDEIANCPPDAWSAHIRPALSTRGCLGSAWLIGVPEGRNFYYDLHLKGKARAENGAWDSFTWKSAEIIPAEEVEAARGELDPRTFRQEYEGSFETFQGRAYYEFDVEASARRAKYDMDRELVFCFDFNVSPGVAVVVQEWPEGTYVIGEVYVPEHSNTPMICARLAADWGAHRGDVVCRGDQTGGTRKTSSIAGSDWDLIRVHLGKHFPPRIPGPGAEPIHRFRIDLPSANPRERHRVNAMNARIKAANGERRLFIDPRRAPKTFRDLDSVESDDQGFLVKKSSGPGRLLTHCSDALGYHVWRVHPVTGGPQFGVERIRF
jgi:hypothetical protein